jgi:hypothetical protein
VDMSMCVIQLGFVFCGCIEVASGVGLRWCFLAGAGARLLPQLVP